MNVLFLEAPYRGEIELCQATLDYLKKKKYKTVALYASVQFCPTLEKVKEQLQKLNIKYITSQPDRTHVSSQLLGCDNYHSSLNLAEKELQQIGCYLYVGDGKFHPLALVYAQKDSSAIKEIVSDDPLGKKMIIMDQNDIKIIKNLLKDVSTKKDLKRFETRVTKRFDQFATPDRHGFSGFQTAAKQDCL